MTRRSTDQADNRYLTKYADISSRLDSLAYELARTPEMVNAAEARVTGLNEEVKALGQPSARNRQVIEPEILMPKLALVHALIAMKDDSAADVSQHINTAVCLADASGVREALIKWVKNAIGCAKTHKMLSLLQAAAKDIDEREL
jgi:hypothetical protein